MIQGHVIFLAKEIVLFGLFIHLSIVKVPLTYLRFAHHFPIFGTSRYGRDAILSPKVFFPLQLNTIGYIQTYNLRYLRMIICVEQACADTPSHQYHLVPVVIMPKEITILVSYLLESSLPHVN